MTQQQPKGTRYNSRQEKGIDTGGGEESRQRKKLYLSKEPIYSVREIAKMLNISTRTLYNYLAYREIEINRSK
ncbi:hypothetical protein AGMMS49574_25590 [Bacteroidia bacterium]|nr:hypothetical protein AGMMS49574_25590 [Bacteroidia bacterium]GHU54907.1 hypothetical protein FACS189411_02380 [Bacteroidia bacterium]